MNALKVHSQIILTIEADDGSFYSVCRLSTLIFELPLIMIYTYTTDSMIDAIEVAASLLWKWGE